MSLSRPSASLSLSGGGSGLAGTSGLDPAQAAVRRIVVGLSVGEAHDMVEIAVWQGSVLADAEPGSQLTIGLGYLDGIDDVLVVDVAGTDRTGWGALVTGYAPSRRLSSTFVGRSYVDKSIGDIVADLLSEGGVDSGTVDASLSIPVVHIDPRRSAWSHLHYLAGRTGSQVTSGADGSISFTAIPGAGGGIGSALTATITIPDPGAELREGAELMAFRAGPRPPETSMALYTPMGAKPGLLLATPDPGSGPAVQVDPLLRTQEAADAASSARMAAARRREHAATVTVPGRSSLRAGSTVTARGQDYRVLTARHVLDADTGYRCDLTLEGAQ